MFAAITLRVISQAKIRESWAHAVVTVVRVVVVERTIRVDVAHVVRVRTYRQFPINILLTFLQFFLCLI